MRAVGAQQRGEHRARVRHQRDRPAPAAGRARGSPSRATPRRRSTNPMQPRAAQGHAGLGGDRREPLAAAPVARRRSSYADRTRRAAVAPARRRGAAAPRARGPRPRAAPGRPGRRCASSVGQHGRPSDLVVPRVDQVDASAPGLRRDLGDQPRAEAARSRRWRRRSRPMRASSMARTRRGVSSAARSGQRRIAGGVAPALLVADRGAGRLHAGDAADAAAGVRRRARVVEPGDRGAVVGVARRRAHVEQLLERQLAVEDVAADQAVLRPPSRAGRRCRGAGSRP